MPVFDQVGAVNFIYSNALLRILPVAVLVFDRRSIGLLAPHPSKELRRYYAPWHFLYFFPLPHQHGSLRPTLG